MSTMLAPLWLLLGPENHEKQQFVQRLYDELRIQNIVYDEYKYYANTDSIKYIIDEMSNSGLFSAFSIGFIYNADVLHKSDCVYLSTYIKRQPQAMLLLCSDEHTIDRNIQNLVQTQYIKIFWSLSEVRKKEWVRSYFHSKQVRIQDDALEELLETTSGDLQILRQECERLVLLHSATHKNNSIDAQAEGSETEAVIHITDIEQYLYHSKKESAYSIFGHIAYKNFSAALEAVHALLLSNESSIGLLSLLLWQFRTIYQLRYSQPNTFLTDARLNQVRIRGKKNQQIYREMARNYSIEHLQKMVMFTMHMDAAVRIHSQVVHVVLWEKYLHDIIQGNSTVQQVYPLL